MKGKRVREKFDFNWMFCKGDISIGKAVKAGMHGGVTDIGKLKRGEWNEIAFTDKSQKAEFDEKNWQEVNLPHDFCVEGNFIHDNNLGTRPASSGYLPTGIGCYRKEFKIAAEDEGKKIFLEFDGVARNAAVWVNGHDMIKHESGYTPFSIDITDVVRYGDEGINVIFVKVDAREGEGWWYEGCGIYRHVWLVKTDRLHVDRFGTYIFTPEVKEDYAKVIVRTTIKNEYKTSKSIQLISTIVDEKLNEVGKCSDIKNIDFYDVCKVEQALKIENPKLWSPEKPTLYKVITEVIEEGKLIDSYETSFGIRSIEFTADKGFLLNGKPYLIKGTCNHQDFAGVGSALPDKIIEYKIKLLKEMGCNAYRSSHNPPTPELLDYCDRLGMLVMDENRKLDSSQKGIEDLKTMLYRDRNHPSVIMWSIENEEDLEGTKMGARIAETLTKTVHRIDPTRPTVAAMNHGWNDGGYSEAVDITGYNYGQRDDQYLKDHERYPNRKMICSESTSSTTTRGIYENNLIKGYCSCYEDNKPSWSCTHEKSWQDVEANPFLTGIFVWTGFDYRGEPTPYEWPCVISHFGIMDICGFPKDAYYFYKAAWTKEPMIHIYPHWNWREKENEIISVWCYSNCEEVELFLNGKSLGSRNVILNNKLVWDVIYVPGKLEAIGKIKNQKVAIKVVETTGVPSRITLNTDNLQLESDGCDVAVIRVSVTDDNGRIVPYADNLIEFYLEGDGKIIGVGNGNPSSHESEKDPLRRAFNGYCMVIVQAGETKGEIILKAKSIGLIGAKIAIKLL